MLTSVCESIADLKEGLMPVTYSSQYREMVLAQVRAGRSVYDLSEQLEVSAATIFRWTKQDQIDAGTAVGLSSQDSAELRVSMAKLMSSVVASAGPRWWPTKVLAVMPPFGWFGG
jgi:hypothetical protein